MIASEARIVVWSGGSLSCETPWLKTKSWLTANSLAFNMNKSGPNKATRVFLQHL